MKIKIQSAFLVLFFACFGVSLQAQTEPNRPQSADKTTPPAQSTQPAPAQNTGRMDATLRKDTLPPGQTTKQVTTPEADRPGHTQDFDRTVRPAQRDTTPPGRATDRTAPKGQDVNRATPVPPGQNKDQQGRDVNRADQKTPVPPGQNQPAKAQPAQGADRAPQNPGTTVAPAAAPDLNIMVGGPTMFSNRTFFDNISNSKQHSTLVTSLRNAGLVEALQGAGPFTIFAPVNDAFENIQPGGAADVAAKTQPAGAKTQQTATLNYHVVPGRYDFDTMARMILSGQTTLGTLGGGLLTIAMNGPHNIVVRDQSGNTANIVTYDVLQSNGVMHVIDTVLQPKF
jgi:uncharacterized surface protein with fasciclin (FAS1) repeats